MRVREWQIRGSSCGFGLALILAVTSAVAVDGNVYNGSECTFAEPDQVDGQLRKSIKLINQSGSTQTISCPLTRDSTTGDVELAYIIASASMDESTCKFWEREEDTSYQSWTNDGVTAVSGSHNKTKWWSSGSGNTTDYASYQITCDLPNNDGVFSYYLEEI